MANQDDNNGYGDAQNQEGQGQSQAAYGNSTDAQQSRGERFDELQGGGRGDSVSGEGGGDPSVNPELEAQADELLGDQQANQDRGQGFIEEEDT